MNSQNILIHLCVIQSITADYISTKDCIYEIKLLAEGSQNEANLFMAVIYLLFTFCVF